MAFDHSEDHSERQSIGVIGSGITGLSAAWALSAAHDVTLFERDARIGGHSNTVDIEVEGSSVPVDTGFIVYNEATYPNLVALFDHLDVKTALSDMSFGASLRQGRCEYSGQSLASVFASPANLASPRFWHMLIDIRRFHAAAKGALRAGVPDQLSLGDFIERHHLSRGFVEDFIGPMAGAIWSTPSASVLDYPARAFLQFYANHGLLQVLNMPEWRTVSGGSRHYTQKLLAAFLGNVRVGAGVQSIARLPSGKVAVTTEVGDVTNFDQVIIATHGDIALAMLLEPTADEQCILSAFRYQSNRAVLHTDERAMPINRAAWSAWNVLERDGQMCVTYWMNRLQPLGVQTNIFVTLNPLQALNDVRGTWDYDHPLYDMNVYRAQRDIWPVQGRGGVWFAGAHLGAGFHEDGLQAGLAVAEAIGGFVRPWQVANPSGRLAMTQMRDHRRERVDG